MRGLLTYFKERFPLPTVALLSLAMAAMLVGTSAVSGLFATGKNHGLVIWLAAIFLCFLLRTRVADEFKDARHDGDKYPHRPLQRGVIKKPALIAIGFVAFAFEFSLAFLLCMFSWNGHAFSWYLVLVAFSILTAFEFFVGRWLEKHFTMYFVLHQMIFVLFAFFGLTLFRTDLLRYNLLAAAGFVMYSAVVEIARKYELRFDASGILVRDTYLAVWGKIGSLASVLLLTGLASWFFSLQKHSPLPLAIFAVLAFSLVLVHRKPKLVQGAIFLNFFAQAAVVYFI